MLTPDQKAELQEHGAQNIRLKLTSYGGGRASALNGFLRCGDVTRGDVEDWLADQSRIEAAQLRATLRWAVIAGVTGIASAILAAVTIVLTIWPPK